MRRMIAIIVLSAGGHAFADLVLKNSGTVVGPVQSLNCGTGATCTRSGTTGTITAGAGTSFNLWDEGVDAGTVSGLSCVGRGVTCTKIGTQAALYVDAGSVTVIAPLLSYDDGGTVAISIETLAGTAPIVATDNGTSITFSFTPTYKLIGFIPSTSLPWDGTSTRSVIGLGQPWTATHLTGIFSAGTGAGTTPITVHRETTGADDGGVCVATVPCASPCPDAGAFCSIPFTGQCQFAATQLVWPSATQSGCTTYPVTNGFQIYGTTQ